MSSKKSSKKSSIESPYTSKLIVNRQDYSLGLKIFIFILSVSFNGAILYYLYNLEDEACKCIRDWRHNFIKGMCVLSFIIILISLINAKTLSMYPHIMTLINLLGFVVFYAIYTYVSDLQTTKCSCAIDKQPKLNKFMKGYVYLIYLISIILGIIIIITLLAFLKIKFIK
jgi:hypothetical protein